MALTSFSILGMNLAFLLVRLLWTNELLLVVSAAEMRRAYPFCYRSSNFDRLAFLDQWIPRGGAEDGSEALANDVEHNEKDESSEPVASKVPKNRPWAIFRLNTEANAAASDMNTASAADSTTRGGALATATTKDIHQKQLSSNPKSQSFSSSSSPDSSEKSEEKSDVGSKDEESDTDKKKLNDVANVWWTNLWTQREILTDEEETVSDPADELQEEPPAPTVEGENRGTEDSNEVSIDAIEGENDEGSIIDLDVVPKMIPKEAETSSNNTLYPDDLGKEETAEIYDTEVAAPEEDTTAKKVIEQGVSAEAHHTLKKKKKHKKRKKKQLLSNEHEGLKSEDLKGNRTEFQDAKPVNITALVENYPPVPATQKAVVRSRTESPYISSGAWIAIDNVVSLGLSNFHRNYKVSRHLRSLRKMTAKATGFHGVLSGKRRRRSVRRPLVATKSDVAARLLQEEAKGDSASLDKQDMGRIRQIAGIQRAKKNLERMEVEQARRAQIRRGKNPLGRFRRDRQRLTSDESKSQRNGEDLTKEELERQSKLSEEEEDRRKRHERVKEIDHLILDGQARLLELQCEKDALQERPNPLYNYTTNEASSEENTTATYSRTFSFPSDDLVSDYLSELFAHGRLSKLNHTFLWRSSENVDDDEDEEMIGDDILTPSADARKLYQVNSPDTKKNIKSEQRNGNGNGGGGSWLLRQSLGRKATLGEKIGEAAETAAYRAICASVMASLARAISGLHGINIMTHSDIRIFMENAPDLPPVGKDVLPGSSNGMDYAQEAIIGAMREGQRKKKKKSQRSKISMLTQEAFIQRDAVVETLISHCQISAPLLKLFPIAWQRALLGNIITLIAAVVSDFCDGIQLQILGHALTFSFKPITESDMIRHIGMAGSGSFFNHRRSRPEQFEAAVRATAEDVSESLRFLDRWHERALGSGMLRAQIANLIARIVLTLADEVFCGARMDLWSAQAGGPRMVAGLEYRMRPTRPL